MANVVHKLPPPAAYHVRAMEALTDVFRLEFIAISAHGVLQISPF